MANAAYAPAAYATGRGRGALHRACERGLVRRLSGFEFAESLGSAGDGHAADDVPRRPNALVVARTGPSANHLDQLGVESGGQAARHEIVGSRLDRVAE